jgi:hypothetical protein
VTAYWSEGSNTRSSSAVSSVPPGKYYINIDTESGDFTQTRQQQFSVTVGRDYPIYDNYWWTLFGLCLIPLYSFFAMHSVEAARWSNSDFSPYPDPESYSDSD